MAAQPQAPRSAGALGRPGAPLPRLLQERSKGARSDGGVAAPRRTLPRAVRQGPGAPGTAQGSLLRSDGRKRLRHRSPLARRRGRHLAIHARRGTRLWARGQLLGRRPPRSGARRRRGRPLPQGPLCPLRLLVPGVRRLQRRLRLGAALDHHLQHQRLLGALSARVGAARGNRRSTFRRSWLRRSSGTTWRRSGLRT